MMLRRLINIMISGIFLVAFASCRDFEPDLKVMASQTEPDERYLNITITVSNGDLAATRAPEGGENGNGREKGIDERENAITGITFILADGPLADSEAKIAFIKYYQVFPPEGTDTYPDDGHDHTNADIEKKYTTGNQLVRRSELDMTEDKTYNVYVVANRNITANVGTNLSTIRDIMLKSNEIFTGNGYDPDGCQNFVMASEQDFTVNFTNAADITINRDDIHNALYYQVNKPILIERLAARIDFCTAYSNDTKNAGYGTFSVNEGGVSKLVSGFKYTTDGGGYYILESITPFNIYNEQEYLFERVTTGWTGTPTTTYLGQETATNYIVDPHTAEKVSKTLAYESPLTATMSPTSWQRTAASLNSQLTSKTKVVSTTDYDNFVVAYCMENTLMSTSPLKTYATGLVITGSYYDKDNKFLSRRTFYGYLRHQGEGGTTYSARELTAANLTADNTRTGDATKPMNFSIVRNNIYRVSIESVDSKGFIKLKLAVHDWRKVTHPTIYL